MLSMPWILSRLWVNRNVRVCVTSRTDAQRGERGGERLMSPCCLPARIDRCNRVMLITVNDQAPFNPSTLCLSVCLPVCLSSVSWRDTTRDRLHPDRSSFPPFSACLPACLLLAMQPFPWWGGCIASMALVFLLFSVVRERSGARTD